MFWGHYCIVKSNCFILTTNTVVSLGVPIFKVFTVKLLQQTGGGWMVRRCDFQCRGVLLIWIIVGQGPIVLAVGAGGGCLGIFFSHLSLLFSFSFSLADGRI